MLVSFFGSPDECESSPRYLPAFGWLQRPAGELETVEVKNAGSLIVLGSQVTDDCHRSNAVTPAPARYTYHLSRLTAKSPQGTSDLLATAVSAPSRFRSFRRWSRVIAAQAIVQIPRWGFTGGIPKARTNRFRRMVSESAALRGQSPQVPGPTTFIGCRFDASHN